METNRYQYLFRHQKAEEKNNRNQEGKTGKAENDTTKSRSGNSGKTV